MSEKNKDGVSEEIWENIESQSNEVKIDALVKFAKWQTTQLNKDYVIFKKEILERLNNLSEVMRFILRVLRSKNLINEKFEKKNLSKLSGGTEGTEDIESIVDILKKGKPLDKSSIEFQRELRGYPSPPHDDLSKVCIKCREPLNRGWYKIHVDCYLSQRREFMEFIEHYIDDLAKTQGEIDIPLCEWKKFKKKYSEEKDDKQT